MKYTANFGLAMPEGSDPPIPGPMSENMEVIDSQLKRVGDSAGVSSIFGREGAVTAQTGDYNVSQITGAVRPNLLDNWYFGNPVNQRGETEYNGAIYTIDRWKISVGASTSLEIVEDGILFAPMSPGNGMVQYIEFAETLAGKTVTFSVLGESLGGDAKFRAFLRAVVDGENKDFSSSYIKDGVALTTAEIPEGTTHAFVAITGDTPLTPCKIKACKLEIGSDQTLAHQDADGNWVLNEIPNYAEELAKCQRYFVRIKNEGTATGFIGTGVATSTNGTICVLPLPVSMRAAPALSGWSGVTFGDGGSSDTTAATSVEAVTAATPYNTRPVVIRGTSTRGDAYVIFLTAGGYLDFSADL